jgi:hypothetical protein
VALEKTSTRIKHKWFPNLVKAPGPFTKALGWLYTLSVVTLGWIWFRADDLPQAWHLFRSFRLDFLRTMGDEHMLMMHVPRLDWYQIEFVLFVWIVVELTRRKGALRPRLAARPWLERMLGAGLIAALLLFGQFDGTKSFIYFQF